MVEETNKNIEQAKQDNLDKKAKVEAFRGVNRTILSNDTSELDVSSPYKMDVEVSMSEKEKKEFDIAQKAPEEENKKDDKDKDESPVDGVEVYENPLEDPYSLDRSKDKAGKETGFKDETFSSKDGDIISYMYDQWLMKGFDWVTNKAIHGMQWGVYGVGYVAVKGSQKGWDKLTAPKTTDGEKVADSKNFHSTYADISEIYTEDATKRDASAVMDHRYFQTKVVRDLVENDLEGKFPNKESMMLYSSLVADNTMNGKSLATTMAKHQLMLEASKNPGVINDKEALSKLYEGKVKENSEKIFHATSQMSPAEASKFLHASLTTLDAVEKKLNDKAESNIEDGKIDYNSKPLEKINQEIQNKYEASLKVYEEVKKENPEVENKGEQLKQKIVKTTFKNAKGNFATQDAVSRKKLRNQVVEKSKDEQVKKLVDKGYSEKRAKKQIEFQNNINSAAHNLAYAEVMSEFSGVKSLDDLTDAEKAELTKKMDEKVRENKVKICKSIQNSVTGYKDSDNFKTQKLDVKIKTLNEISALAANAAGRARKADDDGNIVKNNKYLSHVDEYMKETNASAKLRTDAKGKEVFKGISLVNAANLDKEKSEEMKKLGDKDTDLAKMQSALNHQMGDQDKSKSGDDNDNLQSFNYTNDGSR